MTRRETPVRLLILASLAMCAPAEATAQGWWVDLSGGQVVYDPVSTSIGTASAVGTVRYETLRDAQVYGTAAAPLRSGDPLWGAFGGEGRFVPRRVGRGRATVGLEWGAHGYLFRDAVIERNGRGAILEALPFVSLSSGAPTIEFRGGWRGHTLTYAGSTDGRGVFETGARVAYGSTLRAQADTRWVYASEGTYPFVAGTLLYGGTPVQAWVQAGRWLSTDLDDVTWSMGLRVALDRRATLWANVRQEGSDPLYWNVARRSWSIGMTHRLGMAAPRQLPLVRQDSGDVVIRVRRSEAPGTALWIAGDFNGWEPVPMQPDGRHWIIRLPLGPGVYHYAFRAGVANWFVPAAVAGRQDDGMGGHVAVLVVQ